MSEFFTYGSKAMKTTKGRGKPGGMGHGASGNKHRAVSKGGGNRKGGIGSHQVKMGLHRHKMNNQKIISAMRKS